MRLEAKDLRELIDELLEFWDLEGHPRQMSQPKARVEHAITTTDVARMESVIGLARHVHETARAAVLLIGKGHLNAAVPLTRLIYECALTATWLVQSEGHHAVHAFMGEYTRQQGNLQRTLRDAIATTFKEGAADIADTDGGAYAKTMDNARRFDQICADLAPGGTDAYVYYRALSGISHAGVRVVDLYYSQAPDGTQIPPPRRQPAQAFDNDLLLFLIAASMVWSGRAVTYISKDKGYRSVLRSAARRLEITAEIHLSDAYWERHARR